MRTITALDVETIAFELARQMMSYNEPIPHFTSRFPGVLESCIMVPFQTFTRKPLYKGLLGKAAILFYLMIKNHPFQNGNKRIAMTTLFVFLYKNKKWLKVDNKELYNFTVWVAESPSRLKTDTVKAVETFLKAYLVALQ